MFLSICSSILEMGHFCDYSLGDIAKKKKIVISNSFYHRSVCFMILTFSLVSLLQLFEITVVVTVHFR